MLARFIVGKVSSMTQKDVGELLKLFFAERKYGFTDNSSCR